MTKQQIRQQFPQFAQSPEIPLDNAASARKPERVLEAMDRYYLESCTNVGRGSYRTARRTEDAVESCREQTKRFIGGDDDTKIVFNHGATDGLNMLSRCCAGMLRPGSNVVTTVAEHHSNLLPWMRHCAEHGAQLRVAKPSVRTDSRGNREVVFQPEDVLSLIDENTALITMTACSNVTGSCLPVPQIAHAAHVAGVPVILDAAQLAPHQAMDFRKLGCDALCFSAHKLYGPTGLGVLCADRHFLESLPADMLGGGCVESVDLDTMSYRLRGGHERLEAGTLPIAQILGFSGALAFLEETGMERIAALERSILAYLFEQLSGVDGIHVLHGGPDSAPVVSMTCDFLSCLDLAAMCDTRGIAVRAGKHCAHPFMDFLGLNASVRVSLGVYNTEEDIDALVKLLRHLQRRFAW